MATSRHWLLVPLSLLPVRPFQLAADFLAVVIGPSLLVLCACFAFFFRSYLLDFAFVGQRGVLNGQFRRGQALFLGPVFGQRFSPWRTGAQIIDFSLSRALHFRFFQSNSRIFLFGFGSGNGRFGSGLFDFALTHLGRIRSRRQCGGLVRGLTDGRRRRSLFAFFEVPKVVPNGHANALQRLFTDARNLFELFGRHVGQRLHGGDAAGHQFLDNGLAQLGDLLYGSGRAAGQSLHLLLDFLPLFFFALDVDLPAQQLGGETHVLAFFADGQRKLRVIDDHFKLLFAQVGDGNAADFGWLQRLFGEGCNLVTEFDNVNFFAAQLTDDGLCAHAFHANAGAYRVHIFVAALHGDLGALAGLAGDGADH